MKTSEFNKIKGTVKGYVDELRAMHITCTNNDIFSSFTFNKIRANN